MKRFALFPLLALLAFNACDDDDDPNGPSTQARIRVVNASPGNPQVTLFHNNNQEIGGTAFQTASVCDGALIPAGQQTIEFRTPASTTPLHTETFTFQANQTYTIVLFGSGATLDGAVLQETPVPDASTAGNYQARVINATTTTGDAFVTTPTGAIAGNPTIDNLGAGSQTANAVYRILPTANTRMRLFDDGATTNPRSDYTVDTDELNDSRIVTVVLTAPPSTATTPTGFQFDACGVD